jgi:hypothetical protein
MLRRVVCTICVHSLFESQHVPIRLCLWTQEIDSCHQWMLCVVVDLVVIAKICKSYAHLKLQILYMYANLNIKSALNGP